MLFGVIAVSIAAMGCGSDNGDGAIVGQGGTTGAAGTTGTGGVTMAGGTTGTGGATGQGGMATVGGVGGRGGTTGTGGTSTTPPGMPPCLHTVSLQCPASSRCTSEPFDPSFPDLTNQCFDNGVKNCLSLDLSTLVMTTTTYEPDGALCYEIRTSFSASSNTFEYTDASNTLIATATMEASSNVLNVTCTVDGRSYPWDLSTAPTTACTAGTCVCP